MKSPDQKSSPVATSLVNKAQQGTESTNKTSENRDNLALSERLGVEHAKVTSEDKVKEISAEKMLQEITDIQKHLKEAINEGNENVAEDKVMDVDKGSEDDE